MITRFRAWRERCRATNDRLAQLDILVATGPLNDSFRRN